jgi:1,4-dihydroxy-2-naphthoyl-CoA hydrolase
MSFSYDYTVQFRDTDAAGVGYFASILSLCHVAYEASLIASGIDLKSFVSNPEFAVPIAHVSADFFRPLYCGDRLVIELTPARIDDDKFEVRYQILTSNEVSDLEPRSQVAATATTKHVVINPQRRKRQELPEVIVKWLAQWNQQL